MILECTVFNYKLYIFVSNFWKLCRASLLFINYSSPRWVFLYTALKKCLLFSFILSLFLLQVTVSCTRNQYNSLHDYSSGFSASFLFTTNAIILEVFIQRLFTERPSLLSSHMLRAFILDVNIVAKYII
jgi:hypothetical protein